MSKAKARTAVRLADIAGRCMYVKLDLVFELKEPRSGISEEWNQAAVWKVFAHAMKKAYPSFGIVGYVGLERELDSVHEALEPKAKPRRVRRTETAIHGGEKP